MYKSHTSFVRFIPKFFIFLMPKTLTRRFFLAPHYHWSPPPKQALTNPPCTFFVFLKYWGFWGAFSNVVSV